MSTKLRKVAPQPTLALPRVLDLGTLSDVDWGGPVSIKQLITQGVMQQSTLDQAIGRMNEFYVPVNPRAKTRCIDGRHDPQLDEAQLGPQVPGGAPGAALAYRLGVDKDDLTRGTFFADAENMIAQFIRLGFTPGGHRDEGVHGEETVGCGAIDGMQKILATMINSSLVEDHKRIVKSLLGAAFDREDYLRVLGAAVIVNGRADDYFKNRKYVIELLEEKYANSIATLQGEHREGIVVVNNIMDTTLASNRFSETFDGLQAFGYDMWRSRQMAERILPLPEQELDRKRYVMARVMTTVATLMALTDGSQRLLIRLP